jgi:hypothetical protein
MLNEATNEEDALNDLEASYEKGEISGAVYMQDVIALNNKVSSDEASILGNCANIMGDSSISSEVSAFNTAWAAVMAGSGLQLPNPVGYQSNGPTPMLNEKVNSNGTVTVSFNVTYYHNGPFDKYNIGLNCANYSNGSNLGWMPEDGSEDADGTAWGDELSNADSSGYATFSWDCLPNGQTVDFTITGGQGTFTITATMPASAAVSYSGISQKGDAGLNNFENSLKSV